MTDPASSRTARAVECRICGGTVSEFFDFGRQPVSDSFVRPESTGSEFFFRLAVGICTSCTMVQQLEEIPRQEMFHEDYPYRSSGSTRIYEHFERIAGNLLDVALTGADPFIVEIGSNDGVMLKTIQKAGVRHLGVDPSESVAEFAKADGVRVRVGFFDEDSAAQIAAEDGPADVIFSANTTSHIPYLDSIFRGVEILLAPEGVFVFEDRYLGDIVAQNAFDQIYDEHFYLFSAGSVRTMAERFGFTLVDVEHIAVHGGSMRYTVARPGQRSPTAAVGEFVARERTQGLADPESYQRFASEVRDNCAALVGLLRELRAQGRTVVGYGATAKSATVLNFCEIGPDLVSHVCDSTPAKQGRLTPGTHIPIKPSEAFSAPYPDYALLLAWNHADEIIAKEQGFRDAGGRWIRYVPHVHLV
ncbi:class I SAM-dependent methyltransferase [Amycolatopsis cihanbeyliensis]|uniref:Methylation protein EvaC n=1 Tax=Amycolatopsis cihanbeyliensis TaxID=1128664 RepID=A0A542DS70_AMYCI|nr:class I SAM-dependent methyltransferase [Amycolatopsis cihanbeyliensis]TQJ05908.1 methylation protein EvaC [Amycolatopsis cihanbeyliensis]